MIDIKTLSDRKLKHLWRKVKEERDVANKAYDAAVAYQKKFMMDTRSYKAYNFDEWDSEDEEEYLKQPKDKRDERGRMLRKDPHGIAAALEKAIRLSDELKMIEKQIITRRDERKTAVAMMAHPRLSEDSPCAGLNSNILRCIMRHL